MIFKVTAAVTKILTVSDSILPTMEPYDYFGTNETDSSKVKLEIIDRPSMGMLTVFIVASIIGFTGNCVILSVIIGSKKFRIKTNYMIANLSVGSIFYFMFGAFAFVYRSLLLAWPYGLGLCQLYLMLSRLPVTILSFTTIAICTDRNHIVANPLSHRSGIVIFAQIVLIWVSSSILMIPLGLAGSIEQTTSSSREDPSTAEHCIEAWTHCKAQIAYSLSLFLLVHLLPVLIMLRGMWRIRKIMKFLLRSQSLFSSGDRRVRLMRNSCIFFSIFITCWLPSGIFRLPLDLPKHLLPAKLVVDLSYYTDISRITGYVLTCIIPLLLFALSHDLRQHLGNLSCWFELIKEPKFDDQLLQLPSIVKSGK